MERLDIVSFVFGSAVKSLWPQKISSRSENYSARSKLLLVSDKDRDLVESSTKIQAFFLQLQKLRL